MMEPTTVWMVHLARGAPTDGVKGTLSLDEQALIFSTASQDIRFALSSVKRARRRKGSPVLQLEWRDQGTVRYTAFFFVQPPPLRPLETGSDGTDPVPRPAGLLGGSRMTKSRHRKTNIRYLQLKGVNTKEVIGAWAEEIGRHLS